MAIMLSTIPRTRWTLAAPDAKTRSTSTADEEPRKGTSPAQLSKTGRLLLTEHFVRQLRKKLYDQKDVLALVDHSQSWVFEILYREFHAVRAAATLLKQHNMASVAARGEVLVQLLKHRVVCYERRHRELLEDTLHILSGILDRIERDGSDFRCFSTARTALCLYAAAEPTTQYYEPSHLPSATA
ncbi:MAG TPA: hypothetical protein VMG12_19055 [Polyangiaceae bacterium]|nr:hypothetical protein [Polyangiaceae bacterium]